MLDAGICRDEFDIVPFPVNYPELLFNYVPHDAKYYMTIYDEWSLEKKRSLEQIGCDIDIMWTRSNAEKITSGTEIRRLIQEGENWQHLVPAFVYQYVISNKIDQRIRNIL